MKTSARLSRLRHPWERPVFLVVVVINALLCLGAIVTYVRGGIWLFAKFPALTTYESEIRAIAVAALLAPPALVFTRNARLARVRGGSVKVSPTQYPALFHRFNELCDRLGVAEPPDLWLSDEAIGSHAHSYSSWNREFVVLSTDFAESDLGPLTDVWSFLLGRELGRLAFGYVSWWDELLIAYVERIPWIRRPLRHVRTYSLDHVGAHLVPEGVRGLIIQAAGRRTLPATNIPEQIRYANSVQGFWVRLSNLTQEEAHLSTRIKNLYQRGLFDLEHDLARFPRDAGAS